MIGVRVCMWSLLLAFWFFFFFFFFVDLFICTKLCYYICITPSYTLSGVWARDGHLIFIIASDTEGVIVLFFINFNFSDYS